MARPTEAIRASRRTDAGYWQVSFAQSPGWHLSKVSIERPREDAIEWAKRNKFALLSKTRRPLREYAKDFFDPDGPWVYRMGQKGKTFDARTLKNRAGYLKNYVLPLFGDRLPGDLDCQEIDDVILNVKRCKGGEKPLAPGTRDDILEVFKILLDDLEYHKIIDSNPLAGVVRYSDEPVVPRKALPRDDMPKLFPVEHGALIRIWGSPMYAAMMLAFADTGMRPAEMSGLTWKQLIPEEIGEGEGKRLLWSFVFQGVKKGKLRAVGLSTRTVQELSIWRAQSPFPGEDDYIFTATGTKGLTSDSMLHAFRRGAVRALGERAARWITYSLRHNFVSRSLPLLSEAEIGILAGHSVEVQRKFYQDIDIQTALERSREAREKLDRSRG